VEKKMRKMISMNSHLHQLEPLLMELELQVQQLETDLEQFLQIQFIIITILWFNLRTYLDSKQSRGMVK